MFALFRYLPNALRVIRFCISISLSCLFYIDPYKNYIPAIIIVSYIIDVFAVYTARKRNYGSNSGIYLDYLADKVFFIIAYIVLYRDNVISLPIVSMLLLREIIVVIGNYILPDIISNSLSLLGKFFTFLQYLFIYYSMIGTTYIQYVAFVVIFLGYLTLYMYIHDVFSRYSPNDSQQYHNMQENICLVISGDDINSFTIQTAIKTFPHAHVLNLSEYKINFYRKQNIAHDTIEHDDFEDCMKALLAHKMIVFVTPVYWYSTTAELKVFMDRLADLLYVKEYSQYKQMWHEKKFAAIVTYARDQGYALPIIEQTCKYLGGDFITSWIIYKRHISQIKQHIFQNKCMHAANSSTQ